MNTAQETNKLFIFAGFILTLAVASVIRYQGMWFGYPLPLHADEGLVISTGLLIIDSGELNPNFFYYPSFNIYIQAFIYKCTRALGLLYLDNFSTEQTVRGMPLIWLYIAGRTFNLVLSILTIVVTFNIGKKLFSPLAGLLAAVFLSLSYLHIVHSYLLTVDTTVAFWSSLAVLMAAQIYSQGTKTRYYLLGGIFVGLAIGSKYTAFVAAAPLLIAHAAKTRLWKPQIDRNLIIYLLIIPVVFFATSPYVLLDFSSFMRDIRDLSETYSNGHPGATAEATTSYTLYARHIFFKGYGIAPTLFALGGLVLLLAKAPWKAWIIAAFPVLLLLLVGRYKAYFPRNIVAVTPFLALLSGYLLACLFTTFTNRFQALNEPVRKYLSGCLILFILAGSVWNQAERSMAHIRQITLPDTRWISLQWIEENFPAGTKIGREHYTPPVELNSSRFNSYYLGFFGAILRQDEQRTVDYMIVSSGDYQRFLNQPDRYPDESKAYQEFFSTHKLIKEFTPVPGESSGPEISIYQLRRK